MKCLICFISLFLTQYLYSQKLSTLSLKKLRENIGVDLKGYEFYSYPTNNFGVGTSCINKWIPKGNMVTDMIESYGLSNIPSSNYSWKTVNGFAFMGEDGVSIKVNEDLQSVFTLEMLLPKILNILNLNTSLKNNNVKSLSLTIDSGYKRFLNYTKFIKFIEASPGSEIQKAYARKKLLVATSDFIVAGFSLTISKSDSLGGTLITKLDSLIKSGKNVIMDKASLEMAISRNTDGSFTIVSRKPIIMAVFVKKQTPLSTYSEGFETWETAKEADFY
jgi:hypothetical protein